jgi:glycosyltransferase involved in cell wall biosynthesis
MSVGLACISFDCPTGPRDMIIDGQNGFFVKLQDNEDYINKLKMLMSNKQMRLDFSNEAIKLKDRHNSKRIVNNFISDIQNLL